MTRTMVPKSLATSSNKGFLPHSPIIILMSIYSFESTDGFADPKRMLLQTCDDAKVKKIPSSRLRFIPLIKPIEQQHDAASRTNGRSKLPRPWNFHISCLDEHHVHVLVLRSAYSEAEVLDRFHLASKLLKAVLLNIANIAKSRRLRSPLLCYAAAA